ncbi:MAG: hypothetical protein ABWY83_10305, partial [Actinomycetota bacterium]
MTGPEVTEIRLPVPEVGKRLLPLPVAAWHGTVGAQVLDEIAKGDRGARARVARPSLLPDGELQTTS